MNLGLSSPAALSRLQRQLERDLDRAVFKGVERIDLAGRSITLVLENTEGTWELELFAGEGDLELNYAPRDSGPRRRS